MTHEEKNKRIKKKKQKIEQTNRPAQTKLNQTKQIKEKMESDFEDDDDIIFENG